MAAGGLIGLPGLIGLSSQPGCGSGEGPWEAASKPPIHPPERSPLESVFSPVHGIEVPRTVLECPAGACILLHFAVREDYQPSVMTDVLFGRPETDADDGQIVAEAKPPWQVERAAEWVQFNCCTFAVGEAIGLGRSDWLCGEVNPLTDGTNPMQVVLDSYYEQVAEFAPPFSSRAIELFATSSELREDDVVCLVGSSGPEYPHAMRVRRRGDRHWVVGKFGEDPILWTPLETVGGVYEREFDRVWVFRLIDSA
jgi:hypothetical protein